MCWDRFKCYIEGGHPPGSGTHVRQPGCRCSLHPTSDCIKLVPGMRLSFIKSSDWWGGSVASVHFHKESSFYGRMYLIRVDQFNDIVAQENNLSPGAVDIDLPSVKRAGHLSVLPNLYGTCVYVGQKEGKPIYTFTTSPTVDEEAYEPTQIHKHSRKPSKAYLSTIVKGLLECVSMMIPDDQFCIMDYLLSVKEVEHHWPEEELEDLIERIDEHRALL